MFGVLCRLADNNKHCKDIPNRNRYCLVLLLLLRLIAIATVKKSRYSLLSLITVRMSRCSPCTTIEITLKKCSNIDV